jgi:type IV pilus assembly protein PilQ
MGNWTKTKAAGILFVAAAAVYSDGLVRAMAGEKAIPTAADGNSTTTPTNTPAAAAPTTQPAAAAKPVAAAKPAAKAAARKVVASKPASTKQVASAAKPATAVKTTAAAKPATTATATKTVAAKAAPAKPQAAVAAAVPAKVKPATTKVVASKVVASKPVTVAAANKPAATSTKVLVGKAAGKAKVGKTFAAPAAAEEVTETTTVEAVETNETATTQPETQPTAVDPFAEAPATPIETTGAVSAKGAAALTDANVNVSDAGLVEIHVNDANLGEVLKMLSMQLERNILASKEVRGTVTANLYDVTVKEALDAILRANDCGYREKGNVLYVYTKKEMDEIEKAERKQVTETFRLYYTPAANAVSMIKPVLSPEAQVSFTTPAVVGIETTKDVGGNSHATEDTLVVTDFPDRLEQVRKVLKEVDRRPQQVLIEAVILRATLKEDNELGVDFSVLGGVDFSALSGMVAGGGLSNITPGQVDKGFSAVQAGGSGLKVGVVTNNVSVFVNALEGVTDTAVVANPKVLVLNKQPGSVHVGARLGYRTAVTSETLTTDDVKFLEIGTHLRFRPFIGNDGFIRMEISPKDSSGNITNELPNEFVTEVTSNVMVRDGHTIVIGGLFRESSDSSRSQVPGLGNIPVAGHLFKKQKDSTVREEVIILLTPHIIKDEDAYEQLSAEELKTVERMRVGTRRGMMPWGRERLADSAYQKAVEELKKPNPDRKKALWHLDCATNLNPKFVEAIALKAQLRGEEVTASDGSTVRSFVQRAVLADRRGLENMPPSAATMPSGNGHMPEMAPVGSTEADAEQAEVPATQPVAEADGESTDELPTTQPVADATDGDLENPDAATTQPGAEASTEETGAVEEVMPAEDPSAAPAEETAEVPTEEAALAPTGDDSATGSENANDVAAVEVTEVPQPEQKKDDEVQDVLVEIQADDAVNK